MQELIKLITIVGPTASGKSELAVFLAKKLDGEIISADSRQVYKYLDVGTNKVSGRWQYTQHIQHKKLHNSAIAKICNIYVFVYKNIPHHCIDFVHPRKTFSVAKYKTCAEQAISQIVQRGRIPILVGGTGFYIQVVVDGIMLPEVPPDKKLWKDLENKSTEELYILLQKLDPNRAVGIDAKNPRRLIRAIEIATTLGKVPIAKKQSPYNVLLIGIKKTDAELKAAIAKRSKKLLTGLLKETKQLLQMKIPKKRIRELGFEYRLALTYLEIGRPSELELMHMLAKETWHYAKRQMTWFKRDKRIRWIKTKKDAELVVCAFLNM